MATTRTNDPTTPVKDPAPVDAPPDQPIPARPAPKAKDAPRSMKDLRQSRAGKRASRSKPVENVLREGLRLERVPDPSILVLFGATGDLAHRKVMPALYHLWRTNLLPHEFVLLAIGRRDYDDETFRAEIKASLEQFSRVLPLDEAAWRSFSEHIRYHRQDFADPAGYDVLCERLDELDRQLEEINRQWTAADDIRPAPVQKPRPRIIVGGRARPRTFAAAVRFADEYNTISPSLDEARDRAAIVARAAEQAGREPLVFSMTKACVVGRDRREVEARVQARGRIGGRTDDVALIRGTVEEVAESLRAYARVGVERAMLQHLHHEDVEMIELLGDVARELRE